MNKVIVKSLVSEGVEIVGDIKSKSSIRIDGKLRGNIAVDGGGVILGPKGSVEGTIQACEFIVLGHVRGDVRVDHLEIRDGGRVDGDISYKTIEIYKGGSFSGNTTRPENERQDELAEKS